LQSLRRVTTLAVLLWPAVAAAEPLEGTVFDGITMEPIAGATLTAPDGSVATTDKIGHFILALEAGPLELVVTAPGYEPTIESVQLVEGGILDQIIILFTPGAAGEIIQVEEEAPLPPPPGKQNLRREEISKIPGTRGDALTAVRSLPGVGSTPAAGNGPGQIVIRGAAPEDSKITLDGIEIPILYHFFGLQSVLPTEFIENIEFLPGGFGAEEGRATGGVINIATRAEAVTEAEGFAELSFINLAGFVQAPISVEHGVQIAGAIRRSTIDLILPVVIPDSANLAFTTAPQYYDAQVRLDWRKSDHDRVTVMAIGSYDLLSLLNDNINPNDPDFRGSFENSTSFTRLITSWHHAKDGVDNRLVGAFGTSGFSVDIADNFLRANRLTAELRDDVAWKATKRLKLRAGGEARFDRRDVAVRFPMAPAEGEPPPSSFSILPTVEYNEIIHANVTAAYVASDFQPTSSTTVTSGLRFDYYHHIAEPTVSPRLQVTQAIGDDWTARLAMGRYSRGLEFAESAPTDLDPEIAYQYVLGAEHDLSEGVTAEASLFYTDRRRLVVVDALRAQTDPINAYVNRGVGRSFGGEALLRARTDHFFGWLAYTLSRSDRIDSPIAAQRLFDFDQTHNLIAVASYTWGKWQFGGKWQYATGTPLTPVVGSLYLSDLNAFIPIYGGVNTARLEATHQLDLRVDRSWTFNSWKLSAYLDIANVYAHAQVLGYQYSYDFSESEPITQIPFLPAIGVRGEM